MFFFFFKKKTCFNHIIFFFKCKELGWTFLYTFVAVFLLRKLNFLSRAGVVASRSSPHSSRLLCSSAWTRTPLQLGNQSRALVGTIQCFKLPGSGLPQTSVLALVCLFLQILFYFCGDRGSCYLRRPGSLPLPPKCWCYRPAPPCSQTLFRFSLYNYVEPAWLIKAVQAGL